MKRILLMVLRNLLFVPGAWLKLCKMAKDPDKYTKEQKLALIQDIVTKAKRGGNVEVLTYGLENIPEEDGFMLYPNHQGMFDMLAIIDGLGRLTSAVVKKEAAGTPFVKQIMALVNAFAIDREDIRQSMEVILNVTKEVKKGNNYTIFAEGTRSRNGNVTGEFKGGSFKCATKAKCPIIPVALIDSFKPFDSHSIKQVTVQVHYLEPLYYEDYKDLNTLQIAALVKERIDDAIAKNAK